MAKGARSSSRKKLGSWRRENLTPAWQGSADEKRAAAMAKCLAAPSVEPFVNTRDPQPDADMERGREGAPRRQKQRKAILPGSESMDEEEEEELPEGKRRKNKKGTGLAGRVQKKRKAGKLFMIGQKNQFHAKKFSKKKKA